MRLNENDKMEIGDIIHFNKWETLKIKDGLQGATVESVSHRDPRVWVERPEKKSWWTRFKIWWYS